MLHFHNTLTRATEPFEPLNPPAVHIYNCGPTVYSSQHIGNFRTYVFTDLLRRFLDYRGYEVTQVMNITDVGHLRDEVHDAGEDKLEAAARKENLDPWVLAEKYSDEFFAGLDLLNIRRAHHYPRATDNITQMIEIIQGLVDNDIAYVVDNEVYFDVSRFNDYGKLSGNLPQELIDGASDRVDSEIMDRKRSPRDFALWKHDPHHIMQWDSPWGRGFPGWHIECSAMSRRYLGDTLDIHTGGENNIFPHHECEIAQSEAFTGEVFVRYWLHAAHLNLEGDKMAKSEGNVLLPQDLVDDGFSPSQIRYYLLSVHYRQPMNFTMDGLRAASAAHDRLLNFVDSLEHRTTGDPDGSSSPEIAALVEESREQFGAALDDDLNISQALASLFDLARLLNQKKLSAEDAQCALQYFREIDTILSILPDRREELDTTVEGLIEEREAARQRKDFKESDRIRDELLAMDIVLMDTPEGVRWTRK